MIFSQKENNRIIIDLHSKINNKIINDLFPKNKIIRIIMI